MLCPCKRYYWRTIWSSRELMRGGSRFVLEHFLLCPFFIVFMLFCFVIYYRVYVHGEADDNELNCINYRWTIFMIIDLFSSKKYRIDFQKSLINPIFPNFHSTSKNIMIKKSTISKISLNKNYLTRIFSAIEPQNRNTNLPQISQTMNPSWCIDHISVNIYIIIIYECRK